MVKRRREVSGVPYGFTREEAEQLVDPKRWSSVLPRGVLRELKSIGITCPEDLGRFTKTQLEKKSLSAHARFAISYIAIVSGITPKPEGHPDSLASIHLTLGELWRLIRAGYDSLEKLDGVTPAQLAEIGVGTTDSEPVEKIHEALQRAGYSGIRFSRKEEGAMAITGAWGDVAQKTRKNLEDMGIHDLEALSERANRSPEDTKAIRSAIHSGRAISHVNKFLREADLSPIPSLSLKKKIVVPWPPKTPAPETVPESIPVQRLAPKRKAVLPEPLLNTESIKTVVEVAARTVVREELDAKFQQLFAALQQRISEFLGEVVKEEVSQQIEASRDSREKKALELVMPWINSFRDDEEAFISLRLLMRLLARK